MGTKRSPKDPFAFLREEIGGNLSPSRLAVFRNSPFLNSRRPPTVTDPLPPADDPILICSLPEPPPGTSPPENKSDGKPDAPQLPKKPIQSKTPQANRKTEGKLAKEPIQSEKPQPEKKTNGEPVNQSVQHKSGGSKGSRRRSRGVQLRSSDSEEQDMPAALKIAATAALGSRVLPATITALQKEEKQKESTKKVGSSDGNASGKTPAITIEEDKRKESTKKVGSSGGNANGKTPAITVEEASMLSQPSCDRSGENADISEVAAMGGTRAGTLRVHKPGGCNPTSKGKESGKKVGSSGANANGKKLPTTAEGALMQLLEPFCEKSLENANILEVAAMAGIRVGPIRWHKPDRYNPEPKSKGEGSSKKVRSCDGNASWKKPEIDLKLLLEPFCDKVLENADPLEVAAKVGMIGPIRWHRPGGYKPEPKSKGEGSSKKVRSCDGNASEKKADIHLRMLLEPFCNKILGEC